MKKLSLWGMTIILCFGFFLRLYKATSIALWHDEGLSVFLTRLPWGELLNHIAQDVQAPFYYILLKLWQIPFGSSVLALRSMSILFGVAAIWAGYLFVKEAFKNQRLALAAALFLAINPFQIQHSQEVRMYSLGVFLILLASYFLVKALNNGKIWIWVCYVITAAACIYTHYYLGFSLIAHGIYCLWAMYSERKINRQACVSFGSIVVLFLPWLPVFLRQLTRVEIQSFLPSPTRWSIPATIYRMLFAGFDLEHYDLFLLSSLLALIIVAGLIYKNRKPVSWLMVLSLILPFAGSIIISFKQNIYLDRYFIFASAFFDVLIAAAIWRIPKSFVRGAVITAFIILSLAAFHTNWRDLEIENKPGMPAAAQIVNEQAKPEDKIYVASSFVYLTFEYYNRTGIHPLLYGPHGLEEIPYFSGTAVIGREDLVEDFNKTPGGSTVWMVWTNGYDLFKLPVPANWRQTYENAWQDAPDFKGHVFVTKYTVN